MKNKAKGIGGALTRKIGPLPVWVYALLGFVGVWYYRNKLSAGASGTGTGSVTPTPPTPQPGQVLEPGESYYDPNTGAMSTAPGGGGGNGSTTTPPDYSGLVQAITDAITAAEQGGGSSGGSGGGSGGGGGKHPGTKPDKPPKLKGKGAIRARFGRTKPKARKGYTIRGLGRGFWEYVPTKRKPKPKDQHGKPAKTTKTNKSGDKKRQRSTATVKNKTGGRTTGRGTGGTIASAKAKGKWRGGAKATASQARVQSGRRGTPLSHSAVLRQRPVASSQPRRTAPTPAAAGRTASTPPRTTRTVSKPPARKPPPRKRKK